MEETLYEVVISGMSGRFPECDTVDDFAKKLFDNENLITVDDRKWPVNYSYKHGSLKIPAATGKFCNIDRLDAREFKINHVLANMYDICNAKVLEPAFEAIVDSGINPAQLNGANIGVYVGLTISECDTILNTEETPPKFPLYILASSKCMASNRLSFALNLRGPSITVMSMQQAGMETLALAYKHLREGRIDGAVVSVASSIVDPKLSIHYLQLGFLSPDGLSRVFDENANGYGRSEASVSLFLQRTIDAKRVYATVLHSDMIYFGSDNRTMLNIRQEHVARCLHHVYSRCDIQPSKVSFIEMNACGIKWLDEAESNAVAEVFCTERDSLCVGSVKSNVGHTDASSGLVSIVKSLIALDSNCIPANINSNNPDTGIHALKSGKLKIVSENLELPGPVIGVNSIGLSGGFGHCILKQHSKSSRHSPKKESECNDVLPRLVLVFGRTEDGLKKSLAKIENLKFDKYFVALANDVFSVNMRSHLYRGYAILQPTYSTHPINGFDMITEKKRPIWFLFCGMGCQWNGMGKDLLKIPTFAAAIDKINIALKPFNIDLRKILTTKDPNLFDDVTNTLVAIAAVQIGLVDILKIIGIEPDGIIGHSAGETGCAYADGCFTAEEAILSAYYRGLASMQIKTIDGMMAAIGRGYHEIKDTLPHGIEIACHNSKDNCTISGPLKQVNDYVSKLKKGGIFAKTVNAGGKAYHSKYIASAGPLLMEYLKKLIPTPKLRSEKWISTCVPESEWHSDLAKYCSAEYHTNNMIGSVLFEEGCKYIPSNAVIIEIAPHGLLQAIMRRSVSSNCINIPLATRLENTNGVNYLLSAIGKLFLAGCQPNVNALYPKVEYPVPRGTPGLASIISWDHSDSWGVPHLVPEPPLSEEITKICLSKGNKYGFIYDHQINGRCIIPPSLYIYIVWDMMSRIHGNEIINMSITFENIQIHRNLSISSANDRSFSIMIQYGSGNFEVTLEDECDQHEVDLKKCQIIMSGTILRSDSTNKYAVSNTTEIFDISSSEFYEILEELGYNLNGCFKNVKGLSFEEEDIYGTILWNQNWVAFLDSLMKIFTYSDLIEQDDCVLFPDQILKLSINASCFSTMDSGSEISFYKGNATNTLFCNGIEIRGICCKPLNAELYKHNEYYVDIQSLQFVPHLCPHVQSSSAFISLALEIIIENVSSVASNGIRVAADLSSNNLINVKNFIKLNPNFKSKILLSELKEKTDDRGKWHLLIFDDLDKYLKRKFICKMDHLFVFSTISADKLETVNEFGYSIVAKQEFDNSAIILLKKINNQNGLRRNIVIPEKDWKSEVKDLGLKHTPVTVVWSNFYASEIMSIFDQTRCLPYVRSLFILDKKAPPFSKEEELYKKQLDQDLVIAILKNGQWGTYRNLERSVISPLTVSKYRKTLMQHLLHSNNQTECNRINFIALNESLILDKDCCTGFEYSGVNDKGARIMGLGTYDRSKCEITMDPLLKWSVPDNWTLEEAATIPYAYTQASYILSNIPSRGQPNSILLHGGDSIFGYTCINLLSQSTKFRIFTTVSNQKNATELKSKYQILRDTDILVNSDCFFDIRIKYLTNFEGVGVIINSLGSKYTQSSFECLGRFGYYVEINQGTYDSNFNLGLQPFLRCLSFTTIEDGICSMLDLPEKMKKKLFESVEKTIASDVIKPFDHKVITQNGIQLQHIKLSGKMKTLFQCHTDSVQNVTLNTMSQKLKFSDTASYIVIGGIESKIKCTEILKCLIKRGARKFLVTCEFLFAENMSYEFSRLLARKKISMSLISMNDFMTVQSAEECLSNATKIGPIEAVFFMSPGLVDTMNNLNIASRSFEPCYFISFWSEGIEICERRRNVGVPATVITIDKSKQKLSFVWPFIESLTQQQFDENYPILLNLINCSPISETNRTDVSYYLPNRIDILQEIGVEVGDVAKFMETTSFSPKHEDTKAVLPIFIIPAAGITRLQTLIQRLIHPVYYASIPAQFDKYEQIISSLLTDLMRIQPEGPVTMIGETWCAYLSIELASILQKNGRQIRLFLIEGSPSMWKSMIDPNDVFELLKNTFQKILKVPGNCLNGLKIPSDLYTLENVEKDKKCKNTILLAFKHLYNHLLFTSNYSSRPKTLLTDVIHLKQHGYLHNSFNEQYCSSDDVQFLNGDSYEQFIVNPQLAHIINENSLHSWWFK